MENDSKQLTEGSFDTFEKNLQLKFICQHEKKSGPFYVTTVTYLRQTYGFLTMDPTTLFTCRRMHRLQQPGSKSELDDDDDDETWAQVKPHNALPDRPCCSNPVVPSSICVAEQAIFLYCLLSAIQSVTNGHQDQNCKVLISLRRKQSTLPCNLESRGKGKGKFVQKYYQCGLADTEA